MLKPVAYLTTDPDCKPLHEASVAEKFYNEVSIAEMTPLYAIPEGYALVPIEATEEIIDNAVNSVYEAICIGDQNYGEITKRVYEAIIKAGGVK